MRRDDHACENTLMVRSDPWAMEPATATEANSPCVPGRGGSCRAMGGLVLTLVQLARPLSCGLQSSRALRSQRAHCLLHGDHSEQKAQGTCWGPGKGRPHIHYQTVSVSKNFTAARMSWSLSRWVGSSRDVLHSVVWIKERHREKARQHPEGLAQALGGMNSLKVSGSVPPGPVLFSRRCYHYDSSDVSEPWTPRPRETRVRRHE